MTDDLDAFLGESVECCEKTQRIAIDCDTEQPKTGCVVVADKMLHKGRLHASIGSGGATINISHGIALKFIAVNDQFVTVQVLNSGIGQEVKNQSWIKQPKSVIAKKKKCKKVLPTSNNEIQTEVI